MTSGDDSPQSLEDLCADAYPPGQVFEPADMPREGDPLHAPAEELAVAWRRQWQPGQEVRVRFLDGDPSVQERVRRHATTWLEFANLAFNFGNHPNAEIRVTFVGAGYWSHVGTDALQVPRDRPTMQLGGFHAGTDEIALRRTVLHEFGHAIGCVHEQASPAVEIPWEPERVYAHYQAWQGWDRAKTYRNVLYRYSAEGVRFTSHDPESIMQYPIPAALTRGGFSIGWNDDLSAGDRDFIARMYPAVRR
jgi:hypothetical protein